MVRRVPTSGDGMGHRVEVRSQTRAPMGMVVAIAAVERVVVRVAAGVVAVVV